MDNRSLENLAGTEPFKWNGGNPDMPTECGPRTEKFFYRSQSFNQQQLTDLVTFVLSFLTVQTVIGLATGDSLPAQERGKAIFERTKPKSGAAIAEANQCTYCHSGPKYTNQKQLDMGSGKLTDRSPVVDVPQSLTWLIPPPICTTVRRVRWKKFGPCTTRKTLHGVTNDLTKDELNDLIEYLKTL